MAFTFKSLLQFNINLLFFYEFLIIIFKIIYILC